MTAKIKLTLLREISHQNNVPFVKEFSFNFRKTKTEATAVVNTPVRQLRYKVN